MAKKFVSRECSGLIIFQFLKKLNLYRNGQIMSRSKGIACYFNGKALNRQTLI